jgi:hypothetical protein
MLALIAAEAERSGTPLTEEERRTLLGGWDPETVVPDDFRAKAKNFIEQTFTYEPDPDSPISLGHSVMWAGEDGYPMIVALTEEVMRERGEKSPLRGKRAIIDFIQLICCAFVSVILLMLFAAFVSWLFGHPW